MNKKKDQTDTETQNTWEEEEWEDEVQSTGVTKFWEGLHKQHFLGTITEHIDLEIVSHDKSLVNRKLWLPPPTCAPLNHMSALVYNPTRGGVEEDDVWGNGGAGRVISGQEHEGATVSQWPACESQAKTFITLLRAIYSITPDTCKHISDNANKQEW